MVKKEEKSITNPVHYTPIHDQVQKSDILEASPSLAIMNGLFNEFNHDPDLIYNPEVTEEFDFNLINSFSDSMNMSPESSSSASPNFDKPTPHDPSISHNSSFSKSKTISASSSQVSIADNKRNPHSEVLSRYQFGRELNADSLRLKSESMFAPSSDVNKPPSYMLDFNADDWKNVSNNKYKITFDEVPSKSRVETQIKLSMNIYPPPSENLLHLPADAISKPKLQLKDKFQPSSAVLSIDVVVVCESDHKQYVNICQGCMKREHKRASRKKVTSAIEDAHWNKDKDKRAIVFNCRELVEMGDIETINVNGKPVQSRRVNLPMRMACYCRHHNEKMGFRALFVIKDYTGKVVARGASDSIMITDDHKGSMPKFNVGAKRPNSEIDYHLSPGSETEGPRKRKSETSPREFSRYPSVSASSPLQSTSVISPFENTRLPSDLPSNSADLLSSRAVSNFASPTEVPLATSGEISDGWMQVPTASPEVERIIPPTGSVRGGIEVTLLGNGFIQGLTTKFGDYVSPSTSWWNPNTVVAILPPSREPGPVVLSFQGYSMPDHKVFSYYDDTDNNLIQMALQVVGLKMNGRLEDAREIARRIVNTTSFNPDNVKVLDMWQNHSSQLSLDALEGLLLQCLQLIDSYKSDFNPNYQYCNGEGQTMLHLASSLGLKTFASQLLQRGSRVDVQDKSGYSPLHFAGLKRHQELMDLLLEHGASPGLTTYAGETYEKLRDSEFTKVNITLDSFRFNGDNETDSDMSDSMSEESDVEMEDSSACESEEDEEIELQIKVKRKGLTGFLASLGFNKPNTRHGTTLHEHESTFWNMIYPNTGEALNEGETSEDKVQGPPSYEEIFPAGSSDANPDYSAAALEPEKKVIATAPETITTRAVAAAAAAGLGQKFIAHGSIQVTQKRRLRFRAARITIGVP
ncbi:hypothetical protein DV495_000992 [Geotrichum candidum]|nr:hypothetical protein DV495_000992 [Geotrichum candidum]